MLPETELASLRRAYARQITRVAGVRSAALEEAFAAIKREDFLGPAPWRIARSAGYKSTDDPAQLYTDVLVAIAPERGLNNGQPSAHALWIDSATPKPGEHVVHIGAGIGYYSAILARLVGPKGRVTAIEYDPALAARATANLALFANTTVVQGDGAVVPFDPADVIYVNAGTTRPADSWLDGLKEGGRLVLPLTTERNFTSRLSRAHPEGAMFRIERRGSRFFARWISGVAIIPCESMRDEVSEAALAAALANGGWDEVTRLYRTGNIAAEYCWLRAPDWCLAFE
jgi:protein-L-isoaspartate(D-aspartate) O-methyltransferase